MSFEQRLQQIAGHPGLLTGIRRGVEKESLRIDPDGRLAQTPHPATLGSALTHSSITTDYSEALLEFITPVDTDISATLGQLADIHRFVYSQLETELLWTASMPCLLEGDDQIPIARYGSSNIAKMKEVYREGLGHRYGRLMQTIAGIHYNFSMPDTYWDLVHEHATGSPSDDALRTERYFSLIRNFRRHSWLLIYLFGASPAVCRSFVRDHPDHGLDPFDERGMSLHTQYGTSLRMGDLGYQSNAQQGLNICYNSLADYIATLRTAIVTPHPEYQQLGVQAYGDWQQLNTSLLQIENEFYSPIRPKRVARSGEIPLGALCRGGVEYIEVRCLDINPFLPMGLDEELIRFVDAFLLYCLLADSPPCDDDEAELIADNLHTVVYRGREPGLKLRAGAGQEQLQKLGSDLLTLIGEVASALDTAHGSSAHSDAVAAQVAKLSVPELTPSAEVLQRMREQQTPYFRVAMNQSLQWAEHFRGETPDAQQMEAQRREASDSIQRQAAIESADEIEFGEFLDRYYQQYDALPC